MKQKLAFADDHFHDECGVFGVFGHPEAANLTYLGLYALQHRGQESAGIVASDGTDLHVHRAMGEVEEIFIPSVLAKLPGSSAIGHTRYSTAGDKAILNAQPIMIDCNKGKIAVGHNGNLTNAADWRRKLEHRGSIFQTNSDTEVIVHLIARSQARNLSGALGDALNQVEGAYSLLVLTQDELYAIRDPRGFRPLVLGKLPSPDGQDAWVVASETCAFDLLDAKYIREVEPGEMVRISRSGIESIRFSPPKPHQYCIFEHVYFSRPDSIIFGRSVTNSREMLGRLLAQEHPVIRNFGVKLKLNPVRELVAGKRVVLVDDSIVRGTTSRKLVRMMRDAGAKEVHMRISCPPTISPCYYGVDTPTKEELIASSNTPEQICKYLGADSLGYLSLGGLKQSVNDNEGKFCTSCYTGNYPTDLVQLEVRESSSNGKTTEAVTVEHES